MNTLFLEQDGKRIMTHICSSKEHAMQIVNQYQKTVCPSKTYMRMWNEEKGGEIMTCIDFGRWSEFFYLHPALDISEEFGS